MNAHFHMAESLKEVHGSSMLACCRRKDIFSGDRLHRWTWSHNTLEASFHSSRSERTKLKSTQLQSILVCPSVEQHYKASSTRTLSKRQWRTK